jgi:hypothetical protein
MKDEKDLNSTKMDQRGKTPDRQKKKRRRDNVNAVMKIRVP